MSKKVPLSQALRELRAIVDQPEQVPTYRKMWLMVAGGELPADVVNTRYHADPKVLAEKLGLTVKVAA